MSIPMPSHVTERTFALSGGKVQSRVLSAGSGDPVVFLHGAGGLAWTPLLEALAERYAVHAPEHPGANQTDLAHLRDQWDLVLYYDDLLDALGLDTTALVGHSFGGMVAAELAANSRRRISKLVLIAPIGFWRDDAPIADLAGISPQRLLELTLHDPSSPLAATMSPPKNDPQALFENAVRMASILHFIWPIPDKGLRHRIHRVSAPTLLVWGERDAMVSPVYAREYAGLLQRSETVLVADAGHLPQLEQTGRVREAVLGFLDRPAAELPGA